MNMPSFTPPLPARIACAILLCALAGIMAYWAIQLTTPSQPVATLPPEPAREAELPRAARVLASRETTTHIDTLPDVRLIGTVSTGGQSRAVLLSQGKPVTLSRGEEVSPGVTLGEVGPNFIELQAGPATRRIELAEPKKPAPAKGAKP